MTDIFKKVELGVDEHGNIKISTSDGRRWRNFPNEQSSRVINIHVTSDEILQLASNPKVLIEAPGESKYIWPVGVFPSYHFGTTPYVVDENVRETITWEDSGLIEIYSNAAPFLTAEESIATPFVID